MKTVVSYLCLLIAARLCAANLFDDENQGIEIPENCELISGTDQHYLTCPELLMSMETSNYTDNKHQNFTEYSSTIACSPDTNFLPYKYLPNMKSNRNSLWLKECDLPEHGSFGDGWPRLELFSFTNSEGVGSLKREHFSELKNVWKLDFHINSSSHAIPDDLFTDLKELRELRMTVRKANENIFKNLSKLELLSINIKSLESVNDFDSNVLKNLPNLKTLALYFTHFTRLTKRFFEGCQNIENLQIKLCEIDAIDADAFQPLTNLKNFTFLWNNVTSLPEGLFSQNLKLENVEIAYNDDLTSLPSGLFSNLPNLREINIKGNLHTIPNDLIRGSFNLELLDLQFNKLSWIPRDLLQNHNKLKNIKLAGNRFDDDDKSNNLFDNMSPETVLSFKYNRKSD